MKYSKNVNKIGQVNEIHTHVLYRTTQMHQYQKGKTSLDFTDARDSEWQWR